MSVPRNIKESREPQRRKGIVFSDFQERVNHVKVVYKSSSKMPAYEFGVWYWPAKFDDDMARRLDSGGRSQDEDIADVINSVLETIVKEWEIVYTEGGENIPPVEIMTSLELSLKTAVMRAIQEDLRPGETTRQRSGASSRQTVG